MGRNRRNGKREKNGRLSRKPGDVTQRRKDAFDTEAQANMATAIDARQRLFGLSYEEAKDQRASTFIGRLCLGRELSRTQYEALCMWEESARANAAIMAGPMTDSAFDPNRVAGMSGGENQQRDAAIRKRHKEAEHAIQDKQNELRGTVTLFAALYECVQRDREVHHLVGDLRAAANALARHYGLEARKAA